MRRPRTWSRCVAAAVLVTYGILIPLLVADSVWAHKHFVNGEWAHSVDRGDPDRLRIWNQNVNGSNVGYAIVSWANVNSSVRLSQLSEENKPRRDVKTARFGERDAPLVDDCYEQEWLGLYNYLGRSVPDVIYINYCMAYWDGGYWPATDKWKDYTSSDRRLRTYVHEVGHALGLQHNDYGQCTSVLADIPSDWGTRCYGVQEHDVDDMRIYWPR